MDFLQPMPEIPGPEVMSEAARTINLSDNASDVADKTEFTTAQDPTVERGQQPKQRFAFEAALGANTKQTKKLRKELNEGLQSGKLDKASTVRYLESLPEPGDDNFDADLYTKYADFVIDGGDLTYAQWLKTQQ